MVATTKDGAPVVPVCVDCRWVDDDIPPYCHSPKIKGNFDVVYGWRPTSIYCRDARKDPDGCGVPGNFYEPKPVPKPLNLWQRFVAWLTRR